MAAQEKLNELAERKRLLVLQADLHRAVLQAEVANARTRLLWVGQVREKLPGGPWWLAGGAVAGFFALRQWRTALKWLPAGLAAWRWFKKLKTG
jgi:hypothetical protein